MYEKRKVIVRGCDSGVFYGTLTSREGSEVTLENCRRIWEWNGAASLSQIAVEGIKDHSEQTKLTMAVDSIQILDAIEVIPCTDYAINDLDSIPVWKI